MKQFAVKEREIDGNKYFIKPFGAFTASRVSGDLFAILFPMIGSLAPAAAIAFMNEEKGKLDTDIDKAFPAIIAGFSSLNGEKAEKMLRQLLVDYKNIAVEREGSNKTEQLTKDLADELFCGDVQDLYILAYDVIKVNFRGFSKRLESLFGNPHALLRELIQKKAPSLGTTESLTQTNSQPLS